MRFPFNLRENSTELKTKAIKTKGYSVLAVRILKSLRS